MKQIFALLACLLMGSILFAQTNRDEVFLHLKDRHYAILRSDTVFVYIMQIYYDKLGRKPHIQRIDTLLRNTSNSFGGVNCGLIQENNTWFLTQKVKKKERKARLDTATNVKDMYYKLNEAYYVTQYFEISSEINKAYPLNRHSYHDSYHSWNTMPNQYAHYLNFKPLADNRIKSIKDSIIRNLAKYESLRNFIAQNAKTAAYEILKDSLSKLSLPKNVKINDEMETEMRLYYRKAVHEIGEQRPEYFFKLAEDLPDNQHDIFFSINYTEKELLAKLKSVKGNEIVKKKFFKEQRRDKRASIVGVTLYVTSSVLFWGLLFVWIF